MNAKENLLEAVHFGSPQYVPLANEPVWHFFQLDGNFRPESWTDGWGIGWEVGLEGTVPFPKGNPLRSMDGFSDYRMPNPDDLVLPEEMKHELSNIVRGEQLVCGRLNYLLVERAWAIMGMERFLTAMLTDPEEMHALCHGIADYARRVFDRYLDLGFVTE